MLPTHLTPRSNLKHETPLKTVCVLGVALAAWCSGCILRQGIRLRNTDFTATSIIVSGLAWSLRQRCRSTVSTAL